MLTKHKMVLSMSKIFVMTGWGLVLLMGKLFLGGRVFHVEYSYGQMVVCCALYLWCKMLRVSFILFDC